MLQAARPAMVIVLAAAAFDVMVVSLVHSEDRALFVGLNLVILLVAFVGRVALKGPARRIPETVVFTTTMTIVWSSVALGILGSAAAILAVGYLLVLPAIVTMVIPWRPRTHTVWLVAFGIGAVILLGLAPDRSLTSAQRVDLVVLLIVAIAASFVGMVLGFRRRVRDFRQLTELRSMRHVAEAAQRAATRAEVALQLAVRLDVLTGVGNRLRLEEDLRVARSRLGRTGESFGLLEADVDRFKLVNDHFGHVAGDTVLSRIATTLRETCRASDTVYRYGGEEFVILLTASDVASTAALAERFRAAVEALAIDHPGNPPSGLVTISLGGTLIGLDDIHATNDTWFAAADLAMYAAKDGGRNRVVIASDRPTHPG